MDDKGPETDGRSAWRARASARRPAMLIGTVVALGLAMALLGVAGRLDALAGWIRSLGLLGFAAFALVRAAAVVAVVPGSPLTAAAVLLFGPAQAVLWAGVGKTLGALCAFVIARYLARDGVESWLARRPRYSRLDNLVGRHGALVVALMRLVPLVPFNVQSYGFGLTAVPAGVYVLFTFLGNLPWEVFGVTGVAVVKQTFEGGQVPWRLLGAFGASAVVICVAVLYVLIRLGAEWRATKRDDHSAGADSGSGV